jgi:hypothetical protein
MSRSPVLWLLVFLAALLFITFLAPSEKTLGPNVRVVYLHGVWVWTALVLFFAAAVTGLVGLIFRWEAWHGWSRALGRTGLVFWIPYLPISLWAMQTNWNGLFLAEPRWRLAMIFSIFGFLLQAGVTLLEKPVWASWANLGYFLALMIALRFTSTVMHPPSPILDSEVSRIQFYFAGMLALTLLAAWQVARLWHRLERPRPVMSQTSGMAGQKTLNHEEREGL